VSAPSAPKGYLTAGALAILSIAAMTDMAFGYLLIRPLAWVAVLLTVAIGCALVGRRNGTASLAAEPYGMGIMTVLSLFHGHGGEVAASASAAGHASHLERPLWALLAAVLLVLCAVCVRCAYRRIRAGGVGRGLLPAASATGMCVATLAMLLQW
jgi:hypothetical protein